MRFSQAALSPRRMKSHIQKNCSLSASQLPIRLQPVFSAIKISSCVPSTHRILFICACLLTQLSSPCSPSRAFIAPHSSATSHCIRKTSAQWHSKQSSFITVAGPCRIFTCFHLSSETARPASKNTESSIQFTF